MQSNVWRGHHQAPRRIDEDNQSPQQQNMQYGYNGPQQQQQMHQQQQQQQQPQMQNQQGPQQQQQQQQGPQPVQQQQQQQQQQPQLQAVDQNGNPIPVASNVGDGSSQNGSQNPPMNLASVLHYLQSEWRRWERDRNEWEIERAEMRARIALLEGERRSAENLKTDMMRRVKMLEFALRQERSKTLSSASGSTLGNQNTLAHAKLTSLITEEKASHEKDKEGRGSGGSGSGSGGGESPKSAGGHLPNGKAGKSEMTGAGTWNTAASGPWKGALSAPSRDGKSRARSRDYLKQCLQEISYLTSAAALNPLPNKLAFELSLPRPASPGAADEKSQQTKDKPPIPIELPLRPKKVLEEEEIKPKAAEAGEKKADVQPPVVEKKAEEEEVAPLTKASDSESKPVVAAVESSKSAPAEPETSSTSSTESKVDDRRSGSAWIGSSASSSSSKDATLTGGSDKVLTAIYKPESKEVWKKALQTANEQAEKAQKDGKAEIRSGGLAESAMAADVDTPLDSLSEAGEMAATAKSHWKQSRQLKSHLDAVRSVAFGVNGETLVSGSGDCTVKVWKLDFNRLVSSKNAGAGAGHEIEPQMTFRGHTAAVTSLAVAQTGVIFSGSMDATIRAWQTPPPSHDTYSSYDPSMTLDTLIGHTDSVWDIALLPSRQHEEGYLVSASADGTVKVWDTAPMYSNDKKGYSLLRTWTYAGTDGADTSKENHSIPMSVAPCHPDYQNVLVGFKNGVVKAYNLLTGKAVMTFGAEEDDLSPCNQVMCHPTLDIVVSAHDDGKLRFYDSKTARLTSTVVADTDAVNAIDMDPNSSSTLVSGGDDCSCKIWDMTTGTSTQDWSHHRRKDSQGVLAVKFGDKVPVLASGGADGVVRVYIRNT